MGTLPEIQVDQVLVWNAGLFCQGLEVLDHIIAQAHGDLLPEILGVWIADRIREIIFLFHIPSHIACVHSELLCGLK